MQRKYFVYAVKSKAGVNTAETISSLHTFKQSLTGSFFVNHEHKGSETFSGNAFISSAGSCLFSALSCSRLISLALEFIA